MAADDRFQRLRDSINATIGARTTELRRDNITMMERASAFRQQPGQTMPRMQRTRMWFVHVTGVPVGDTHLRTHSIKIFGEQGLGKANNGNTCCFSPTMSASDFEVKLRDLLPGLGRGEFDLLINRSQRLHSLNGRNPSALKAEFGRSRSALYCRPKGRDPNQAHQPADRPHSEEPHLQITVPRHAFIPPLSIDSNSEDEFDMNPLRRMRRPENSIPRVAAIAEIPPQNSLDVPQEFDPEIVPQQQGLQERETLVETRRIRAEQDAAVLQSLEIDRGRDRDRQREADLVQERASRLHQLQTHHSELLRSAPLLTGFTIRIRNDGRERRFNGNDTLSKLCSFIYAGAEDLHFEARWQGCNQQIRSTDLHSTVTLNSIGLATATVLDLHWNPTATLPAGTENMDFDEDGPVWVTVNDVSSEPSTTDDSDSDDDSIAWQRPPGFGNCQASLSTYQQEEMTLEDSMHRFARHGKLLQAVLKRFGRKDFRPSETPQIKFIGEEGQDGGGIRREFFSILLRQMQEDSGLLFDTGKGHLPVLDFTNLATVKTLGVLIAMMIVHSGPAPTIFHRALVDFAHSGEVHHAQDFFSKKEKEDLDKFSRGEANEETVQHLIEDTKSSKTNLSKQVAVTAVLAQRKAAMAPFFTAFWEGAQKLHLRQNIVLHPELCQLIDFAPAKVLTAQDLINIMEPKFEDLERGSNIRRHAEVLFEAFETFLYDCQDGETDVTLAQLLGFLTGVQSLVPGGFSKTIEIRFCDRPDLPLPRVSTCALQVELSAQLSVTQLRQKLVQGVREGGGFHLL